MKNKIEKQGERELGQLQISAEASIISRIRAQVRVTGPS
jgi:hypothetical protein